MRERLSRKVERSLPGILLGGLSLVFLLTACTGAGKDVAPLRVGYMICNSLEETRKRFGPLTAYLAEQLGREVRPVYLDTVDFEEAVKAGEFDIIHTNSLLYVWFNDTYDFRILSGEIRGKYGSFASGSIVVHADSDIRTIEDLKGKRFVFGPPLAPTAFLSPYYLLLEAGVDPETDLGYYAIPWGSFKHEKALYGVWHGKYDAGSAPSLDLEQMVRDSKIPLEDLRVIAEGPRIPYCVFSAPPSLPDETFRKVQSVLFKLDEDATAAVGGEILEGLRSAGVEGFEPLEEADFDPVRTMARVARLPPYAEY
jgi:phosphonate transport system substrate-binding protein